MYNLKSKNNKIIGFVSIIGGIIFLILGLSMGQFYFASIELIILGIGKVIISSKLRNNAQ